MRGRARILVTIAACMSATSVAAQTPAPTTAFDGTYVGVSRTSEGDMYAASPTPRGCTPNRQPGPLTIAGGVARYNGSTLVPATWEGSVNAQRVLVMHELLGSRIGAQINGRGTVTGRATSYCSYQMVWQKEGK